MLGVYSALTNRVFPIEVANRDGTLVLLLHRIKLFLLRFEDVIKDFEEEAGDELVEAEEEGRAGVRRLLLSREWASLRSLKPEGKSALSISKASRFCCYDSGWYSCRELWKAHGHNASIWNCGEHFSFFPFHWGRKL